MGHTLCSLAPAEAAVVSMASGTSFPGRRGGGGGLSSPRAGPPGEEAQAWLANGSLPGVDREQAHIHLKGLNTGGKGALPSGHRQRERW